MKRAFGIGILSICVSIGLNAQSASIPVQRTTATIELDGQLKESIWREVEAVSGFTQNFPTDTALAKDQTLVRMVYDDRYLYIGAICYHEPGARKIVQSLRRDFSISNNDHFAVYLNPMNDLRTGFAFIVNPYGSQTEGTIGTGGAFGYAAAWDNRWFAETYQSDSFWSVEMAIPFKTLRYKTEPKEWHLNFSRASLSANEVSTWQKVPRGFDPATFAYAGTMQWDTSPPAAGSNISIIPYVTAGVQSRYHYDQIPDDRQHLMNTGVDAKIAVSSALNLDLTVNPDFSQVEVDEQIINLERFSVFLPEKRNFFLENDDLFSRFGFSKIRPFFSRRIGLDRGRRIPILAGARLTGNVNENWRIGGMMIQTEGQPATASDAPTASQNFMVGAFERKVFGVSNIAGIVVNRLAFDGVNPLEDDFNTLVGLDYNIADKQERFRGKLFYHHTFSPGLPKDAGANASWLRYRTRKVFLEWNHEYVGDNYKADVGFVPRIGYFRLEPIFRYYLYFDDHPKVNFLEFGLYQSYYWNQVWQLTDRVIKPNIKIGFQNQSTLDFYYRDLQTRLVSGENFDPTGKSATPLAAENYMYRIGGISYNSDFRKPFTFYGDLSYGTFYAGRKLSWLGGVTYNFRPWGSIGFDVEQNHIWFPDPYASADLVFIGTRVNISFSRSVFLNTWFQYNTATNLINVNTRFQWRFKPMSDLFFVYTENYTDNFTIQDRAFVLKFVYWFTL